ncbi:MAG: nickel pincer cofactor biosynthesis protein LarC [Myxococcota bacterium]
MLHLETFSGIAGNMFLGALLDLGLSRKALVDDLQGLGVEFALRVSRVKRGAIEARYVDVGVPGAAKRGRASKAARRRGGPARHAHAHGHPHGRHYTEIARLIDRARLAAPVRDRALAIFEALARAEARVHGTPIEKVHFHEVGAVDAIVDVTGAAIGLERLGIERVTATPVALGHGSVDTDHGRLPLPAPATLELLKGVPTVPAHVAWETVTPTGAAILKVVAEEYGPLPAMTIEAAGYGAGNDREGAMPNVLRAVLGRAGPYASDRIAVLETNVDDLVPEHFEYLMDRLFEAGALDVSIQHQQMKKNRPGFGVRVLARPKDRDGLARLLMAESTAIGVRTSEWDRLVLPRTVRPLATPLGRIRVKIVEGESGTDVSAEVDDCVKAARRHGIPLREVVRRVEAQARKEWT